MIWLWQALISAAGRLIGLLAVYGAGKRDAAQTGKIEAGEAYQETRERMDNVRTPSTDTVAAARRARERLRQRNANQR